MTESINFNEFLATEVNNYRNADEEDVGEESPRKVIKDKEDFPSIQNKTLYTQENEHRMDFSKKDNGLQSGRGRFPNINRKTSLDNKAVLRIPRSTGSNFKSQ